MPVILRISKNGKKNKAGTHGIGLFSYSLLSWLRFGKQLSGFIQSSTSWIAS